MFHSKDGWFRLGHSWIGTTSQSLYESCCHPAVVNRLVGPDDYIRVMANRGAPEGRVDILSAIVPIFEFEQNGAEVGLSFLGTGALIDDGSLLLTADHVVRGARQVAIYIKGRNGFPLFMASLVESDRSHDLCLLQVAGYRAQHPLIIDFDVRPYSDSDLLTVEYSDTGIDVTAGKFYIRPATRRGYLTRQLDLTDLYGPAGDQILELSFPALKGASGAPVILTNPPVGKAGFFVVGVVVANRAHHLLPAQIETVLRNDNSQLEETRYLLPQGLAVDIQHIRPMYERVRARS